MAEVGGERDEAGRRALARRLDAELGPFDPRHLDALVEIDRATFARSEDAARSLEDVPLPLDDEGLATVSAPHAYLLSFRLLGLAEGDRLVELGSGSGYGAALASRIVGPSGHVTTIEIAPELAARARSLLAPLENVTAHEGDAVRSTHLWDGARRVVCTFPVEAIPDAWLAALPRGGVLVAPVGPPERDQRLVRLVMTDGPPRVTEHGSVRYVRNRSAG